MQALLLFIFTIVVLSLRQAGTGRPQRITAWFVAISLVLTVAYTSFRVV